MSNFYQDVIVKSPRFTSKTCVKDLELLEPVTRAAVLAVIADARAEGVTLAVGETYRSVERQRELYARGATRLRSVGTHGFGVAADLWIMIGKQISWRADYSILTRLGKKHGLISGRDWGHPDRPHTFLDQDHLQRVHVEDQAKLFSGAWYPDALYNPYDPPTWPA